LNSRCRGIKRNGDPCSLSANGADGFCWAHSPEHAQERRRMASRAGKSKPRAEVHLLKTEIKSVISDVKAGGLDRNDAGVMIQAYRCLKDFIELERRVKETDELVERLTQLEESLKQNEGGSGRWRRA
jgi:hypothetical protein